MTHLNQIISFLATVTGFSVDELIVLCLVLLLVTSGIWLRGDALTPITALSEWPTVHRKVS